MWTNWNGGSTTYVRLTSLKRSFQGWRIEIPGIEKECSNILLRRLGEDGKEFPEG